MKCSNIHWFCAICIACVVMANGPLSGTANAQEIMRNAIEVSGRITDEANIPIPNAIVKADQTDVSPVLTNAEGKYKFYLVGQKSHFVLHVTKEGYVEHSSTPNEPNGIVNYNAQLKTGDMVASLRAVGICLTEMGSTEDANIREYLKTDPAYCKLVLTIFEALNGQRLRNPRPDTLIPLDVIMGAYRVACGGQKSTYISEAQCGNIDRVKDALLKTWNDRSRTKMTLFNEIKEGATQNTNR